jgi:hypothetical protein
VERITEGFPPENCRRKTGVKMVQNRGFKKQIELSAFCLLGKGSKKDNKKRK